MNILIIGNGFDLAHGLKTGYTDFLDLIREFSDSRGASCRTDSDGSTCFFCSEPEIFARVSRSDIYKYMRSIREANKGWIDFENELREIVNGVCEFSTDFVRTRSSVSKNGIKLGYRLKSHWEQDASPFMYFFMENHENHDFTHQNSPDIDLDKINGTVFEQISDFIELFRRYIIWLDKFKVPETEEIEPYRSLHIDHLLSFNYTETAPYLYGRQWELKPENICYVHGRVTDDADPSIVMGIGSDYYDACKYSDFLPLFKFYQCYKYKTDTSFLKWLGKDAAVHYSSSLDHLPHEECNIYIYGHSLDPTDENILLNFFDYSPENTDVRIIIYYRRPGSLLSMEKNLIKILGREKFTAYLSGDAPKIMFQKL